PNDITKEWLEQVINSRIQPRIDGIRINQVPLSSQPGKVTYVVYIPQSNRAPHMSSDHRYYKRYNFESIAMEDYEVRDVSRRSEAPDLSITFELERANEVYLRYGDREGSFPIELQASVSNQAVEPAQIFLAKIYVDTRLKVEHRGDLEEAGQI